ncbi:CDP-glycerol glycerophosphotransferase family protein [Bacillus sp. UNC438CL73TsuS30]|uniref:CDP-glycerol glycerophosphotransferase family protein n=1 Tax=Bacillus sp. UNC438CL73TsuS30 TaxID=1340434 RepID=UPI0006917445|nr:CDP-glycerol glycerophosphotransferase family protein [Bacillus sp. UNC438CL73TsuS30]
MVLQSLRKLKRFLTNSNKNRLKKLLRIQQENQMLYISGELNENYKAKELWLISNSEESKFKIAETNLSSTFSFETDITKYEELIQEEIYKFFILVQVPKDRLTESQYNKIQSTAKTIQSPDGSLILEYFIRVGKFEKTDFKGLHEFTLGEKSGIIYLTKNNFVSVAFDKEVNNKPKVKINKIKSTGHQFFISGEVSTNSLRIVEAFILLSGRETGIKVRIPVELDFLPKKTIQSYGNSFYRYQSTVNLNTVLNGKPLEEDIYDFFLDLNLNYSIANTSVRMGHPSIRAKGYSQPAYADGGDMMYIATPYYTIKYFNLSLQINKFERDILVYLKRMMKWAWLLRPLYAYRNIWIVGERPYKAQDTGYRFFKYMRTEHPELNVNYVIEKDSPELENVKELGNILFYGSKEHIWHTIMARRVIGSHHADYLYPLRTDNFKKVVKAKKVFLQHGVMGTKNTVHFYGIKSPSFDTDLFIVSSEYEKSYIVQDFGYNPADVAVTGLSRFDSLFRNDVEVKRQLLIIPTWREWIVNDEIFLESEYFERYRSLVNHPNLHEYARKYHFEIVLCLHPNMQRFTPFFSDAPVRIVSQGEVDVQFLLKESSLMITDYSSVAFDISFLHKPIIYYQFDRDRFIGKQPSHLDLDNDLPGDIVYDLDEVLNCVEKYARTDFEMEPEYKKRAGKFLKYHDLNSCKRIYERTLKIRRKPLYLSLFKNEFVKAAYRKFRKSKLYFPTMKIFYKAAKTVVPIDKNLILFESGLGKQYADSPRYIYEEIVRRGLKYKKVWVYNKQKRFKDRNTIYVKRLSVKYYYYLAKAGYWVNNQNFPTYIKKRPGTTYVQTWHGTPLKKMLFDIENVQGRTDDYVERVSAATKTWDYLISPSPYATNAFKSAFRYEGNILEIGYPRNDIFYREERKVLAGKIRNSLKLPENKKVILYAPTFRDNQTNGTNQFTFDIPFDFELMKEKLGNEYVLLLRMHVVIKNKVTIPEEYKDFVFDVSKYPDIQELYLITDVLITDYSSVMFDFVNLKRPILFYTYDLEFYRDQLRGFYMDLEEEAPGPLIKTNEELINALQNIDKVQERYQVKYNTFYNKFCQLEDGYAAERVVNRIFDTNN